MKRLLYSALLLTLVSIPAFAAKNSSSVTFPDGVTVGSAQLPPGDYKVTWTGTGDNVQVTLVEKDKYSARPVTVTAKVTDSTENRTGFTSEHQGNVNRLHTLQFGKTMLVFDTSAGQ
jgi:hypothetical protein